MRKKLPVICAYLVLLILSLPVPLLHQRLTDRAIESMRPVFKLDDGTLAPMLMPVHILLLRWLGQLSWMFLNLGFLQLRLHLWMFAHYFIIVVKINLVYHK